MKRLETIDGGYVRYCVPNGYTAYCSRYAENGTCASPSYTAVKDCFPYKKSETEGACCPGKLVHEIDNQSLRYPICNQEGSCPYCNEKECLICNEKSGKCETKCDEWASCCGGKCHSYEEMQCTEKPCTKWDSTLCSCVRKCRLINGWHCNTETNECVLCDEKTEVWDKETNSCIEQQTS